MRYSNGGPNLLTVVPFIRYIAPEISGYNRLMHYIGPIRSYIEVSADKIHATSKRLLFLNRFPIFILGISGGTPENTPNQFTSRFH